MAAPATRTPTRSTASRGATALIVVALVLVVASAAWSGRAAWAGSGAFALALFGVPLACAAGALAAERAGTGRLVPVVVGVLAVVSLGWSLVLARAAGFLLVPPLRLLVATLVSWADRRPDRTPPLPG